MPVWGVAKSRFLDLGREEKGAALVVTLAMFFLLYLACCGVFAVSTAVKERIHLQNAADAAAYSAAVVQADTLSRIATINRAMAWTYVQMTRRQMDYVVMRWLEETVAHYNADRVQAAAFSVAHHKCSHGMQGFCPLCVLPPLGWDSDEIYLHGSKNTHGGYSVSELAKECGSGISDHLDGQVGSFYSNSATKEGLKSQIKFELAAIVAMNEAEEKLAESLAARIDLVVNDVLNANLIDESCLYHIERQENPLLDDEERGTEAYLTTLKNNANDEKRFIMFADGAENYYANLFNEGRDVTDEFVFGPGANDWFVQGDEKPENPLDPHDGIHRSYNHLRSEGKNDGGYLYSTWRWFATGWTCGIIVGIHWMIPNSYAQDTDCIHQAHDELRCYCTDAKTSDTGEYTTDRKIFGRGGVVKGLERASGVLRRWISSRCYADNANCYDECYKGYHDDDPVYARPLVLTKAYFSESGTLSVGIRRENRNVFLGILQVIEGVFKAFDPDWNSDKPTHTYVFASAKAGYKFKDQEGKDVDYKVDWKDSNQGWNLCQSDWDAVFVPVCKANASANDERWGEGSDDIMMNWLGGNWMTLNGDKADVSDWDSISAPKGILRGGNHKGTLDWRALSHVMYH